MKRLSLFALTVISVLTCNSLWGMAMPLKTTANNFTASSLSESMTDGISSNETYIVMDVLVEVVADDYPGAPTVDISLLDASGNVLASGQTRGGGSISFARTGHEKKAVLVYHMSSGADFVVVGEMPPM